MSASQVLNAPTYETAFAPNDVLQVPNFCNQCKSWKLIGPKRASKIFHTAHGSRQSRFAQKHLIRYAPKEQSIWSVLHVVGTFKDPLILDKGYFSRLGSSFVIEIQAHAGRIGLEIICKARRKLCKFTTAVAYASVILKPWLHWFNTEPGVCMRILTFTLSWSFGQQLDGNILIFGNVAKRTFICVSCLCRSTWKYL